MPSTMPAQSTEVAGQDRPGRHPPRLVADLETNDMIRRHLDGDPRAFSELVSRYHDRLLRYVNRVINDRERSEDLVQETFLRVARHLKEFDPDRKFSAWIYTIASNLAKNELRARGRSPVLCYESSMSTGEGEPLLLQHEDRSTRPDKVFADRHLRELVASIIALLSPLYREVLVLREVEGRSYEEISGIAGCNLGAVKSRLHRARMTFAALITPHLD
jgi:RNA polymerase sigma-70 factor, ECF subfamily